MSVTSITIDPEDMFAGTRGRATDLSPIWATVVEIMKKSIQENFDRQGPPGGETWIPSQRALREGGLTLVKTGRLKASVCDTVEETARTLTVGTGVPYAAKMATGEGNIPPRPFMAISQDALDEITQLVIQHIFGAG